MGQWDGDGVAPSHYEGEWWFFFFFFLIFIFKVFIFNNNKKMIMINLIKMNKNNGAFT